LTYSNFPDACATPPRDESALAQNATLAAADTLILRGRESIRAHARMLEDFARATGQFAAMHGLQFTLDQEYAARKSPGLVCFVKRHGPAIPLSLETLIGCVLFFEYRIGSWNTGLIATGDSSGIRTVFGAPGNRGRIAALAASVLLRSAHIVLVTFRQDKDPLSKISFPPGLSGLWTAQIREVHDHLPLRHSYDATLATLGKRTRTHLRYYRRYLEKRIPCDFVPDAPSVILPRELVTLNASSLEPMPPEKFDLQYRAATQLPGGFVYGLRARDGRWLSLAGGWRQQTTTIIQWQTNAAGFERFSLGTAFRSFIIEYEVALATTQLCFYGGTSHSMHHAFPAEHVVDLILRRRSLFAFLVASQTPMVAERSPALTERGNFLVEVLRNRSLEWLSLSEAPSRQLENF
jgi:hypothetical protein